MVKSDSLVSYLMFLELYFIVFLLYILLVALFYNTKARNVASLKIIIWNATVGLAVYIILLYFSINYNTYLYFGGILYNSALIVIVKIILCFLVIGIFITMLDYFDHESYLVLELPFIMLMGLEGVFLLLSANDLFVIYLAMELQSLALYLLATLKRYSNMSIEAGLKYFIYGSFASSIMLFGITWVYGFAGTTSLWDLHIYLSVTRVTDAETGVMIGCILMLCGFFFKLGIFPFHNWLADIYEGSGWIIVYFFAVVPKIAIFIVFMRVYRFIYDPVLNILPYVEPIFHIVIICALLSILIGAIGALYQVTLKRLLAYSAIANMGYALLGLSSASIESVISVIYFFFIYLLTLSNIFMILSIVRRYPNMSHINNIVELVALSSNNYMLSFLLVFALFSLAGIPPFIGFFGKFYIFLTLFQQGSYLLGVYGMIFSIVISLYYIRLIRFLWFVKDNNFPAYNIGSIRPRQAYLVASISMLNFVLYFVQDPLLTYLHIICNIVD